MIHRALQAYRKLPLSPRIKARLRYACLRAAPWAFPDQLRPGSAPAVLVPSVPRPGKADFLRLGLIDWHFRYQRPQHLATELARLGHRVFYCSSNLIPESGAGFRVEPLDAQGRLFQVHLSALGVPAIYYRPPCPEATRQLAAGLRAVMRWGAIENPVLILDHPFWLRAVEDLSTGPLTYDRMDLHAGFGDWTAVMDAEEARLIRVADLTVVTSAWLEAQTAHPAKRTALIRNAGDWEHFGTPPANPFLGARGRRVIGYYGAIADWLDAEVIASIAQAFPNALLLLIGHDQAGLHRRLEQLPNVRFIAEVPYCALPEYLYAFDVCLLPFRRMDLTLAVNPVKLYEYLASGRPVVATDLPEMAQFGDLVRTVSDPAGWVAAVRSALDEPDDHALRGARRQFAASQTWAMRARELLDALDPVWKGAT